MNTKKDVFYFFLYPKNIFIHKQKKKYKHVIISMKCFSKVYKRHNCYEDSKSTKGIGMVNDKLCFLSQVLLAKI